MNSYSLRNVLSWLVSILVPLALVLGAVRAIMTPLFLAYEYSQPNFPPDSYGFSKADRLKWSNIALDYLLNSADISFLGDLRFEDGSPVYNERELRHMVDVKNTVRGAMAVLGVAVGALLLLGVWAWRGNWLEEYRRGLGRGGWLTVFLIGGILFLVLAAFGVLFVAFHNVFFQPGTWVFLYSDTLIRLFPERFWRDAFLLVGSLAMGAGLAMAYLFRSPRR